jgi:hypothetical protein
MRPTSELGDYTQKVRGKDLTPRGCLAFTTSLGGALVHFFADMIPYYIWGNTPDDPTSFLQRLTEPMRHGKEINPCDLDYMYNIL